MIQADHARSILELNKTKTTSELDYLIIDAAKKGITFVYYNISEGVSIKSFTRELISNGYSVSYKYGRQLKISFKDLTK